MKSKKKSKSHTKHRRAALLPMGMQRTRTVRKSQIRKENKPENTFSPMETGQPEQDPVPGGRNPQAVQGGLGPLHEEGEGDRQNDQLAELEEIEPEERL